MRYRIAFVVFLLGLASAGRAQTQSSHSLTGRVTSAEEGAMEGVLVSAARADTGLTVTVVSDATGRYAFPASRLQTGHYAIRIRAAGYDLSQAREVDLASGTPMTADLQLVKAKDVAAQLSNSEWLASFPGTEQQKASIRACTHCHTLERIARSRYDAAGLTKVIERMSGYPQLSFPLMIQKLVAPRIGGGEDPLELRMAGWRRQADYLSTVNLSSASEWHYQLKTLPRPTGVATKVIYTEWQLPTRTRQPHDVIVDSQGMAWYASFGEQTLGRLDPKTGTIKEWDIPRLKANLPTGILGVEFDEDENLWLGMQFQGGVARFDRKTEKFTTYPFPPEFDGDFVQINQVAPEHHKVDGKVWLQDAGTYRVFRLDEKTGKYEVFEPFAIPRPNIYDVISDAQNNVYFTVFGRGDIGRIDAKTGKIEIFPTPTPGSAPRRGMSDKEGRVWFGENRAERIGMFDPKTKTFREWKAPTAESWPYDVTADKDGNVWAGGEFSDRVLKLNPATGQFVEYLLPRFTNVRRVFVDNTTSPPSFWVGNNHGASIVKLETLP